MADLVASVEVEELIDRTFGQNRLYLVIADLYAHEFVRSKDGLCSLVYLLFTIRIHRGIGMQKCLLPGFGVLACHTHNKGQKKSCTDCVLGSQEESLRTVLPDHFIIQPENRR